MNPIDILFPLIFVVTAGFICAKIKFLSSVHFEGLRTFIFNLAIPIFLFLSMYKADLQQALSLNLLLSFYLPVVLVYFALCIAFKALGKLSLAESAVLSLSGCYSNTVLVGLPIIIMAFGEHYGALVFMVITFHSALLFALTFALSSNVKGSLGELLKPLLLNPVVLSISLGIVANTMSVPLPTTLINGLDLLSEPAIAGALFVLGASLNQYSVKEAWKGALIISVIKLGLLPAAVFSFATWAFNLPTAHVAVVTLMAASPLGVNAYLVARQLRVKQDVAASSVVLSTLLSVFTLSMWLLTLVP
ncbi:transporter [Pseudoalteromonas phenolica]|uniref:AEC family transporter n=1 Tax=Pseudoalteromonas phenolica TaxID=161398 RepID=UPI00110A88A7|nr:AEC family transporter [Pseudoalteromonas phenolica]TMN92191.1 transporter [Pseudoalteromonas phenolica]